MLIVISQLPPVDLPTLMEAKMLAEVLKGKQGSTPDIRLSEKRKE